MKNLKWLMLAWIVTWSEALPPIGKVEPCPQATPIFVQGIPYLNACVSYKPQSPQSGQKEFQTKKEAENYSSALKVLGAKDILTKEKK